MITYINSATGIGYYAQATQDGWDVMADERPDHMVLRADKQLRVVSRHCSWAAANRKAKRLAYRRVNVNH